MNQVKLKSKKLSKFETNKDTLYHDNKIILTDLRGNIIIYSPDEEKLLQDSISIKRNIKILKNILIFMQIIIFFLSPIISVTYMR